MALVRYIKLHYVKEKLNYSVVELILGFIRRRLASKVKIQASEVIGCYISYALGLLRNLSEKKKQGGPAPYSHHTDSVVK
jgi:hypothetical protein